MATLIPIGNIGGGTGGASTVEGLTDAEEPGKALLKGATQADARAAIDAAGADDIPTWSSIGGKPAVVAAGADAAAARGAIGAGTSSLALGTSGTTAMPGNKTATDLGGATPEDITAAVADLADANAVVPAETGAPVGRFRGFLATDPTDLVEGDWWFIVDGA